MARRRSRPRGRQHTVSVRRRLLRLVVLVPEFAVSGPDQLGWVIRVLHEQLGGPRAVAGRLVASHGPRIREPLREYRELPEVAALFTPPAGGSPASRLAEARMLVRQQVEPDVPERAGALGRERALRRAAALLARKHGLKVFDELNTHAAEPEIRDLLGLRPRRARHRPKGSTTDDLINYVLAEARDKFGIQPATLLRVLGRDPARHWPNWSDTTHTKWLRRRLKRGRALHSETIAARSPEAAIITFLNHYLRLPPEQRLDTLVRVLVANAVPSPPAKF